jgi:hypothetical protein
MHEVDGAGSRFDARGCSRRADDVVRDSAVGFFRLFANQSVQFLAARRESVV